ncbi:MAG: LytTR family DNA-binding domain-containing protein, partial [Candidatus Limivicinus sp.]
ESEIILASVDGKSVRIITADGKWLSRQTLQSLEETLDSHTFIRISRYEIVNLRKVARYDFTISGTLRLELEGGMETWASRRCIPEIRRRLKGKGASEC